MHARAFPPEPDSAARVIIVHTADHCRAALEAAQALGCAPVLQSAPHAIDYAGGLYLKAMIDRAAAAFPSPSFTFIVDCGDRTGAALQALASGHRHLRLDSAMSGFERLCRLAEAYGARVLHGPCESLDLSGCRALADDCRNWLTQVNFPGFHKTFT